MDHLWKVRFITSKGEASWSFASLAEAMRTAEAFSAYPNHQHLVLIETPDHRLMRLSQVVLAPAEHQINDETARRGQEAEWIEVAKEEEELPQVTTASRGAAEQRGVRKAAPDLGLEKNAAYRAEKITSLSPEAKAVARDINQDDNQTAP